MIVEMVDPRSEAVKVLERGVQWGLPGGWVCNAKEDSRNEIYVTASNGKSAVTMRTFGLLPSEVARYLSERISEI